LTLRSQPTHAHRVLLVGGKDRIPTQLAAQLRDKPGHEILADVAGTAEEAVAAALHDGYDAAVCWTEREDDLAGVVPLRHACPDLPILVLSSHVDAAFASTAEKVGATRAAPAPPDSEALADVIRTAVESGDLRREAGKGVRRPGRRQGARGARTLGRSARPAGPKRAPTFLPLLVEDEDDQAQLIVSAFEMAGVFAPLPILKSGKETVEYLSQLAASGKAGGGSVPTVILLDVGLPDQSGLEVLRWIRAQPQFSRLPVVMLTCHSELEIVNEAYRLGANSYLVKPVPFQSMVELVLGLEKFWGMAGRAFEL
jgi:CheY-like chemotaxis protein